MNAADDGAAEPWREDVLLDSHQDLGLGPRLLGLRDVKVHLVPVEVGVVGWADRRVQPEGLVGHDDHLMGHDRHPVKRGLPVEEDYVPVHQLPVDLPSKLELFGHLFGVSVGDFDTSPVGSRDVVDARVFI